MLFVPGPVEMSPEVREILAGGLPYARSPSFSALTLETLARMQRLLDTRGAVVPLTASGTGAMEATVAALAAPGDRALVVNGGTFGARWGELCRALGVAVDELVVPPGADLEPAQLADRLARRPPALVLLTAHETSTGQLFDVAGLCGAARAAGALSVVDAISSVGADDFRMDAWGCDATIVSTQKALALPPGMAFVALSPRAREKALAVPRRSLYFHLPDYLRDLERGQLPYTPAIGILVALHWRLGRILERGVAALIAEHAERAARFRAAAARLGLDTLPARPSNAITAVDTARRGGIARRVVERLRDGYDLQVAPNAPPLDGRVFRVSHLGAQRLEDIDRLIAALTEVLS